MRPTAETQMIKQTMGNHPHTTRRVTQLRSDIHDYRPRHHIGYQCGGGVSMLCSSIIISVFVCIFSIVIPTITSAALPDSFEQVDMPQNFEKQTKITKIINYLIDKSHFRKVSLDNGFSEKVLDRFVNQLDPAKRFFLQEDIDQFQTIKYEFDNYIRLGALEPAYAIFKIFRARVTQRIEYALHRLNQPFDFTLNEQFLLDTKEAVWAQSEAELRDYWRKRIKNDIINLRLARKADNASGHETDDTILKTLRNRYTHIARRTRQFNADDVFQSFINAYVMTIEPHTSYYSPRGAENFKINMRLSLDGIGAVLQTDNEYTLVRRIIAGGPADLAGELKSDDRIIGVGQENEEIVDIIGWRLDDVVDLIRGPKGSTVTLNILPGEHGLNGKPQTITILRNKIRLEEQAAKKRVLRVETEQAQAKIGVIDLPSFYRDFDGKIYDSNYRSTTRDVRKLLTELKDENIDGLIIDIRGNGGGALAEAVELTGLFIPEGPVVQVKNSSGYVQIDRDLDPEIIYDGPLLVLVDRYSASASEIFAGAIQDYNRGLIIGEATFGKGTVQHLVALNRYVSGAEKDLGQIKITIAQFFRINGDSTQHRGVIPDIIWHTSDKKADSGERAFKNAIPWRHIDEASFVPFQPPLDVEILNQTQLKHTSRVTGNPEFDYVLAVNQINQRNRQKKVTPLNQEERRENNRQRDLELLALENNKRKALGQSTFSSIDLLHANQDSRDKNAENKSFSDKKPDIFLLESGKMLADFVHYKALSESRLSTTNPSDTELVEQKLLDSTESMSN